LIGIAAGRSCCRGNDFNKWEWGMKQVLKSIAVLLTGLITFACSETQTSPRGPQAPSYSLGSGGSRQGFSIEGDVVTPAGQHIHLTGGGSFDPSTASNTIGDDTKGHGNGSFSCVDNFPTGRFAGCAAGQGTHWDSEQLLVSSPFTCGFPGEQGKTAFTQEGVIVLKADFYRAGDGDNASFHANMFVANRDLEPDVDGIQNVWIQGVGCGNAVVHFSN
jgi:hypothetical protein